MHDEPTKLLNPAYLRLLVAEYLFQLGMYSVTPITANFATDLGSTLATAGALAGLSAFFAMIARPFAGPVFKRFGQKKLLIFGAVLFVFSSLLCVVAPTLTALSFSRLLYGLAVVFKTTLVVAMGATLAPQSKTGQAIAWIGLGNVMGMALGPVLGSTLIAWFGYTTTYLTSTCLFVLGLLLVVSIKYNEPSQPSSSEPKRAGFLHFPTIPLTVITVFEGFIFGTVSTLTLLICEQRAIDGSAAFFVLYAIVAFAIRPFSSKMYDKHGFLKVSLPVTISMTASVLVLAFAHTQAHILVAAVLFAIGQGCLWPCLQAESVIGVPVEERTLAANTFYLGPDIGLAAGPVVSGAIMELAGITAALLANVAISTILVFLLIPYAKYKKKQQGK